MIKFSVCTVDIDQIYSFLVENDNAFNPAFSTNVDLKKYSEKLYNNAKIYEAWDDCSLVGLLAVYVNTIERKAFVPYICVEKAGVGTSLFSFFLSDLYNCDCVELEVRKSNLKAIGFYNKLGFTMVSETNEKSYLRKIIKVQNVLVSVSCVTYNHSKYIRQCLDSFLMQKTNFAFEVLIHDDASNDGTAEIIREYESKYPDKIKPIYQTENQYSKGISPTFKFNIPRAKGKYIAMCEGDDYWSDPLKLQKQVDFLENNPDYGLVHTGFVNYNQKEGIFLKDDRKSVISGNAFESLILGKSFIATLTVCFKKDLLNKIDLSYMNEAFMMGDYPQWVEMSRLCKIHYMPDVTCVYRVLENSASHSTNSLRSYKFNADVWRIRHYFVKKYDVKHLYELINKEYKCRTAYVNILERKYIKGFKTFLSSGMYSNVFKMFKLVLKSIINR